MRGLLVAAAIAASAALSQSAQAGVVLSDNFDADTPVVLNWPGDGVFLSIPQPGSTPGSPSVDLVGPADGFGSLAFAGNSVDLDGSTGSGFSPAGEIQSIAALAAGNYSVSFELAGNLRGAPAQQTQVCIGGTCQATPILDPAATQGYHLVTLNFAGASGQVSFTDLGPADQQGDLVDNISVSTTPLPATWSMMLLGLAGFGFVAYRRRNEGGLIASA